MSGHDSWSRVPYKIRQQIKTVLLARDGLVCCVCGTRISSVRAATIEHKRERSAGGSVLDYANLGLAHGSCNFGRRGSRLGRVPTVTGVSFFLSEDNRTARAQPFSLPRPLRKSGGDQE